MKKPRNDSPLDRLPENQLLALEEWLFEEQLTYDQALERLHLDFNVRSSRSALGRFYKRVNKQRVLEGIGASTNTAAQVEEKFKQNPADMYAALLKRVGQIAFDQSIELKEHDPEVIYNFTKLLIAGRKEELRAQAIALQRDRFEFDAAKACLKKLPELRAIAQDNKLDQDAKLKQIRLKLFGTLPGE